MAKLNNTDGFTLHGWMVKELGLRGGVLFAFALIHQFSQSEAGIYKGGVPYMAAWLGCSWNTARRYLQALEDRGLVKTERGSINGVPFCFYRVSPDTLKKLEGTLPKFEGNPQEIGGYSPTKCEEGTLTKLEGENNNRKIKGDNKREYSPAFSKPSIEEVRDYCQERGNDIDPEEFWAFYESKGWKVGTAPMRDWKAAILTWERKRRNRPTPQAPSRKEQPLGDYYSNLIQEIREQYGTTPDQQ